MNSFQKFRTCSSFHKISDVNLSPDHFFYPFDHILKCPDLFIWGSIVSLWGFQTKKVWAFFEDFGASIDCEYDYFGINLSHAMPFKLCNDISENLQHIRTKIDHFLVSTRFLLLWIAWYELLLSLLSSVEIWCFKLLVTLYIFECYMIQTRRFIYHPHI